MRIKPFPFLFRRTRPSSVTLKPTIFFPIAFIFRRGKTFDIVQIFGRWNPIGNVRSFLGITEKVQTKILHPVSTFPLESLSTTDASSLKQYALETYIREESLSLADVSSFTYVPIITYNLYDSVSTLDKTSGFSIFDVAQVSLSDQTGSDESLVTEPIPEFEPPARVKTSRFYVPGTIQQAYLEYRQIIDITGGKQIDNKESVVVDDHVVIIHNPQSDIIFRKPGLFLGIYPAGVYEIGTFNKFDYLNPFTANPDDARALISDKPVIKYYQYVAKEITVDINTSGIIRPYPEFEVYIPSVLQMSYYEDIPVEDIFMFSRVIPEFDLNRLRYVLDSFESMYIDESLDIRYYVPPVYTIRFSEVFEIKDAIERIDYYYRISRTESIAINEEVSTSVKVTKISTSESFGVTESVNVVKIAYNSVTISKIYSDRKSLVSPYEITVEISTSKVYTDRRTI